MAQSPMSQPSPSMQSEWVKPEASPSSKSEPTYTTSWDSMRPPALLGGGGGSGGDGGSPVYHPRTDGPSPHGLGGPAGGGGGSGGAHRRGAPQQHHDSGSQKGALSSLELPPGAVLTRTSSSKGGGKVPLSSPPKGARSANSSPKKYGLSIATSLSDVRTRASRRGSYWQAVKVGGEAAGVVAGARAGASVSSGSSINPVVPPPVPPQGGRRRGESDGERGSSGRGKSTDLHASGLPRSKTHGLPVEMTAGKAPEMPSGKGGAEAPDGCESRAGVPMVPRAPSQARPKPGGGTDQGRASPPDVKSPSSGQDRMSSAARDTGGGSASQNSPSKGSSSSKGGGARLESELAATGGDSDDSGASSGASTAARTKMLVSEQGQYLRERAAAIEEARRDWLRRMQLLHEMSDEEEKHRQAMTLMDLKLALDQHMRRVKEETHQLRSLRRSIPSRRAALPESRPPRQRRRYSFASLQEMNHHHGSNINNSSSSGASSPTAAVTAAAGRRDFPEGPPLELLPGISGQDQSVTSAQLDLYLKMKQAGMLPPGLDGSSLGPWGGGSLEAQDVLSSRSSTRERRRTSGGAGSSSNWGAAAAALELGLALKGSSGNISGESGGGGGSGGAGAGAGRVKGGYSEPSGGEDPLRKYARKSTRSSQAGRLRPSASGIDAMYAVLLSLRVSRL
eukprot:jgi/Mesen1/5689/ME000288S04899